ncbi:MAG TPA: phage holin family protein [Parvibaculum sp.]
MLEPTPNMRRLAEAEYLRIEMEARRLTQRMLWTVVSVLVALLALTMLALAVFFALASLYGNTLAALLVGAALSVLALASILYARRKPSRATTLEADLVARTVEDARREVQRDLAAFEKRIDDLNFGLLGLLKGSAGTLPIVTLVLGLLAAVSPSLRRFIMPILKKE